jgi:hypothetical protein
MQWGVLPKIMGAHFFKLCEREFEGRFDGRSEGRLKGDSTSDSTRRNVDSRDNHLTQEGDLKGDSTIEYGDSRSNHLTQKMKNPKAIKITTDLPKIMNRFKCIKPPQASFQWQTVQRSLKGMYRGDTQEAKGVSSVFYLVTSRLSVGMRSNALYITF